MAKLSVLDVALGVMQQKPEALGQALDYAHKLNAERVEKIKELNAAIAERDAELAYLRTVVTEKFARDIEVAVKPEDAAEVAKWARNPEAVRHLIRLEPVCDDFMDGRRCGEYREHHRPDCPNFLAWAALDDPRAAEAIGAAFDRARPVRHDGGWVGTAMHAAEADEMVAVRLSPPGPLADLSPFASPAAFRLASESEQAARERNLDRPFTPESMSEMAAHFEGVPVRLDEALMPNEYRLDGGPQRPSARFGARAWLWFQRSASDARGMEAVEAEARSMDWARGVSTTHLLNREGVTY